MSISGATQVIASATKAVTFSSTGSNDANKEAEKENQTTTGSSGTVASKALKSVGYGSSPQSQASKSSTPIAAAPQQPMMPPNFGASAALGQAGSQIANGAGQLANALKQWGGQGAKRNKDGGGGGRGGGGGGGCNGPGCGRGLGGGDELAKKEETPKAEEPKAEQKVSDLSNNDNETQQLALNDQRQKPDPEIIPEFS